MPFTITPFFVINGKYIWTNNHVIMASHMWFKTIMPIAYVVVFSMF